MPLAPGARLGPYEIVAKLGEGGMGEVYRARDTRLGREVALKVLPADLEEDPERRRRFHQEAVAAGNLNHPNVLTVYDVAQDGGRPFLVTELLRGRSLRELLRAGPVRNAVQVAAALLDGIAAAHASGITHRDIKPENIFITDEGTVKVLDFGLAKIAAGWTWQDGSAVTSTETTAGVLFGTVGYMAPEQITGGHVDHRSDLFGVGVVLYEMLVGRSPFSGGSAIETLNAIVAVDPIIPSTLDPALQHILHRALQKQPARRFQSAADFAFALRLAEGRSSQAKPPERARRLPTIAASIAAVVAVAAIVLLLVDRLRAPADPGSVTLHRVTFQAGKLWSARFLPGGDSVVYSASWSGKPNRLYSARIDFPAATDLALPPADLLALSRSGEVALLLGNRSLQAAEPSSGVLARATTAGSAPREILDNVTAADWAPDGDALAVVHDLGRVRRLEMPIGHSLYETSGWLGPIRVAPDGQRVAFADHPFRNDDRGDLVVADMRGGLSRIARGFEGLAYLAWSPDAQEVWVTVANEGIVGYNLGGKKRVVFRDRREPKLLDVARDGRALMSYEERRVGINAQLASAAAESDLTWFDYSVVTDITRDGTAVLFYEAGELAPERYMVGLRRAQEPAPVRLGDGRATSLSPDGRWALATIFTDPPHLMMYPTGAGEARRVTVPGLVDLHWASFHPDGAHLVVFGNEKNHGARIYLADLNGANRRGVGPEGTLYMWNGISPDGTSVAALDPDHRVAVYSLADGAARLISSSQEDEQPVGWTADGAALFVRTRSVPCRVYRVDLASGARAVWRDIIPQDPTGVARIAPVVIAPDGRAYAYTFGRHLSTLYVATGLH